MATDWYTKIVLTAIAVLLFYLCVVSAAFVQRYTTPRQTQVPPHIANLIAARRAAGENAVVEAAPWAPEGYPQFLVGHRPIAGRVAPAPPSDRQD